MEKVQGLKEAFQKAKVVFMTTYDGDKENTRQMTNFNQDPYVMMWFPTERDTRKVKDIKKSSKLLLTFPSEEKGTFYEITGDAAFASETEVIGKWRWWWLYWHPAQKDRFWFPREKDERRVIINITPVSARKIVKS